MKLSPLSVPYRILRRGGSLLVAAAFALFSGASAAPVGLVGPAVAVALVGAAVLALVGYETAYYLHYEYELTADTLDIRSGVFATRTREIPLRRIQNVDVSRNVLQRALGIAAVDFETAGGSDTEAAIRFVSGQEAARLQRELARRKRDAGDDAAAPDDREELFALNARELALLGALSVDLRVPGALFVLASGATSVFAPHLPSDASGRAALVGAASLIVVVAMLSWAAGAALAVANYYGFRLRRGDGELYYERGLLRRYDGSIPLDKVQTLTVKDNPLKRRFGYATLVIETAGYAPGDDRGQQAAIPLARRERVLALASDVEEFGDPSFERPPRRVRRRYAARYGLAVVVLIGAAVGVDLLLGRSLPWYAVAALFPMVPVAAHYKWKHRGFWLGGEHFVSRNGVLTRRTKVVPYDRVQTILDTRTVFQRRWRLATVTADTAGSLSLIGADAAAVDVDAATADSVRSELADRLQSALAERRSAGNAGDVAGRAE